MARRKSRRRSRAKMGMCGCTSPRKAEMGMCGGTYAEMGVMRGYTQIKLGSMKLLVNTSIGVIRRASDEKYLGKLRKTAKGVYFMNNGKRVYLPDKFAKKMGVGKAQSRRVSRKSKRKSRKAKRKSKRKSRKAKRKSKRKSRKRKAKRKSKRKSRKAKRKSKRKSRKRKAVKRSRGCTRQTDKKYTSRPSPPYPANECCGMEMEGNDGRMYVSKRDKHGVCRWKLA